MKVASAVKKGMVPWVPEPLGLAKLLQRKQVEASTMMVSRSVSSWRRAPRLVLKVGGEHVSPQDEGTELKAPSLVCIAQLRWW